jgi:hypothetical protein
MRYLGRILRYLGMFLIGLAGLLGALGALLS